VGVAITINLKSLPERIGHLTEQYDSFVEQRRALLEQKIAEDEHLTALTQIIRSPNYPDAELQKAIDAWFWDHKAQWGGGEVEKKYPGARGRVLVIMMDRHDNIQLRSEQR
jgi:hypothetical protein